jgi:hypothetical protein
MAFVFLDPEREREIVDVHRQVMQSVFSKSGTWELEKILGNGTYGVTMLVTNVDPLRIQGKQRLVLKRSLLMNDVLRDEDLVKESHNLQVRWCPWASVTLFLRLSELTSRFILPRLFSG